MLKFINAPCDLYVHKEDIERMINGDSGIGYKKLPNNVNENDYELVDKRAFQPIATKYIIDNNSYEVVFIHK